MTNCAVFIHHLPFREISCDKQECQLVTKMSHFQIWMYKNGSYMFGSDGWDWIPWIRNLGLLNQIPQINLRSIKWKETFGRCDRRNVFQTLFVDGVFKLKLDESGERNFFKIFGIFEVSTKKAAVSRIGWSRRPYNRMQHKIWNMFHNHHLIF